MKFRSRSRIKRRPKPSNKGAINLNKSMQLLAKEHYKSIHHYFEEEKTTKTNINLSYIAAKKMKQNALNLTLKPKRNSTSPKKNKIDEQSKKVVLLGKNDKKREPLFFSIIEKGAFTRKKILPSIKQQDDDKLSSNDFFRSMKRIEARKLRKKKLLRRREMKKKHETFSNFFRDGKTFKSSIKQNKREDFFLYKIPDHLTLNNKSFNDFYDSSLAQEIRKMQLENYQMMSQSTAKRRASFRTYIKKALSNYSGSIMNIKSTYGKSILGSMKSSMRGRNSVSVDVFSQNSSIIDERSEEDELDPLENLKRIKRKNEQKRKGMKNIRLQHDQWRKLKYKQSMAIRMKQRKDKRKKQNKKKERKLEKMKTKEFFHVQLEEKAFIKVIRSKKDAFSILPGFIEEKNNLKKYKSYWNEKITIYERFLKKGDLPTRLSFEKVGYYDIFVWGEKLNQLEIRNEVQNIRGEKFVSNFGRDMHFTINFAGHSSFSGSLNELHHTMDFNDYQHFSSEKIKLLKNILVFYFKIREDYMYSRKMLQLKDDFKGLGIEDPTVPLIKNYDNFLSIAQATAENITRANIPICETCMFNGTIKEILKEMYVLDLEEEHQKNIEKFKKNEIVQLQFSEEFQHFPFVEEYYCFETHTRKRYK